MPMTTKGRPRAGWTLRGLCLAAGAFTLAACANEAPAPTEQVTVSTNVVRDAESAGAVQHAPVELNMARDKLEGARRQMQDGDNESARRLAEQGEVDARGAELRARTASAREAVAAVQSGIDTLRRELNASPAS